MSESDGFIGGEAILSYSSSEAQDGGLDDGRVRSPRRLESGRHGDRLEGWSRGRICDHLRNWRGDPDFAVGPIRHLFRAVVRSVELVARAEWRSVDWAGRNHTHSPSLICRYHW